MSDLSSQLHLCVNQHMLGPLVGTRQVWHPLLFLPENMSLAKSDFRFHVIFLQELGSRRQKAKKKLIKINKNKNGSLGVGNEMVGWGKANTVCFFPVCGFFFEMRSHYVAQELCKAGWPQTHLLLSPKGWD